MEKTETGGLLTAAALAAALGVSTNCIKKMRHRGRILPENETPPYLFDIAAVRAALAAERERRREAARRRKIADQQGALRRYYRRTGRTPPAKAETGANGIPAENKTTAETGKKTEDLQET